MATGWEVLDQKPLPAQAAGGWDVASEIPTTPNQSIGDTITGALGGVANAVLNTPYAAVHGLNDLSRRLSGAQTNEPHLQAIENALHVGAPKETQVLGQRIAASAPGQAVAHASQALDNAVPDALRPVVEETAGTLGSVGDVLPAVGTAGVAARGLNAISEGAAAARTALGPAGDVGMRTPGMHPIAAEVAGTSGQRALVQHHQAIGDQIAANAAGHVSQSPMSMDALIEAAGPANSVYNRAAQGLPVKALDGAARAQIEGVNVNDLAGHSPDSLAILQRQKEHLLNGPLSGDEVVQNLSQLRQEAYKRIGMDDVEQNNLGRAQLKMADALEQHIATNLPANGPVSADQLLEARQALAQNHTVRGLLRGPHVDLAGLARLNAAHPGMLSGGLKTVADFAAANPSTTTLASRDYLPPSFLGDLKGFDVFHPLDSTAQVVGGAGARRLLTGSTPEAVASANRMFPARPASAFAPLEPKFDTGGLALAPEGVPPAPASPQGGIPLADLLSHGVEQAAPAGLSVAPMGAPAQTGGLPFRLDAGHMAGGLELAPEASRGAPAAPATDLASVMYGPKVDTGMVGPTEPLVFTSGVPDGTAMRTAARPDITPMGPTSRAPRSSSGAAFGPDGEPLQPPSGPAALLTGPKALGDELPTPRKPMDTTPTPLGPSREEARGLANDLLKGPRKLEEDDKWFTTPRPPKGSKPKKRD